MRGVIGVVVLGAVALCGCSDDAPDEAATVVAADSDTDADSSDASEGDAVFSPSPTTTSDMRPVPTVADADAAPVTSGAVDADGDGVVTAPTLVPGPDDPVDTGQGSAPPSTELVGDPQPEPAATTPPPPVTVEPPPAACDRLAAAGVAEEVAAMVASVESAEPVLGDAGCRYTAGGVLVDVWFVPLTDLDDDWYRRSGIEPVAEAGGAAVGLDGFRGHDGSSGAGYTVATAGTGEGVIVSVGDTPGASLAAGFIAAFAAQAG